jgi:exopolysaccharide production protein ExoZ
MRKQELCSVQYLRAIASLAVLAFHLTDRYGGSLLVGSSGVDIFFVISGFIMWVTTADRGVKPAEFAKKRVIRVVPNYWLATVVTALLILVRPNFMYGHELDASRFAGSLFFLPTLSGSKILPVVLQGWTLVFEMIFYVLFTISLFVQQRYRAYLLAIALGAMAAYHLAATEPHIAAITNPIMLEFIAGVALAMIWKNVAVAPRVALALLVAGAAGLGLSEYFKPNLHEVLKFGVPAALLVAGSVFYEKAGRVANVRIMRFLGDASYSIYIWHVAVATILQGVLLRLHLPLIPQIVLEAFGTVFVTCMIYVSIERPITQFLHNRIASKSLARSQMTGVPSPTD